MLENDEINSGGSHQCLGNDLCFKVMLSCLSFSGILYFCHFGKVADKFLLQENTSQCPLGLW